MGAAGVGATIYFGSRRADAPDPGDRRGLPAGPRARHGHRALVLPAQPRLQDRTATDYHARRRPHRPGQPPRRHDRRPTSSSRSCRRTTAAITATRASARPTTASTPSSRPTTRSTLPLPGGQLLHGPRGPDQLRRRVQGDSDLAEAVRTAVINKRAGGTGLISGRKAFQRPMERGRRAAQRHPGRLPVAGRHDRLKRPRRGARGAANVNCAG